MDASVCAERRKKVKNTEIARQMTNRARRRREKKGRQTEMRYN